MSVTEEANQIDSGANRARLAEPLRPISPDVIDPESSAAEQARLANGPLALTLTTTQPGGMTLGGDASLPRRFVWLRMRPASQWGVALVLLILGLWCALAASDDFVGTWMLSWSLTIHLLGLLIFGDALLAQWGERLPLIGRSWAELRPSGVRMRLFYGRRPGVMGKGFRLLGFVWPCRANIAWSHVAWVAVYTASYDFTSRSPRRTMYWVKLWTANGTGYVALITDMEAQAYELANLLVQHAGLSKWAALNGNDSSLLNPSLDPLDPNTMIIWRADQQRISNASTIGSISAELWRAPRRERLTVAGGLRPGTVIKLALLVPLLVVVFNFDYLISYLIWTPPGPITSDPAWLGDHHDAGNTNASNQTLIPPLHEVWHTPLQESSAPTSLGGGKLLAFSPLFAYTYDATNGSLLKKYSLHNEGYSDGTIASTISPDGNIAYFISASGISVISGIERAQNSQLSALDLNSGRIIWQHRLNGGISFVLEPQRNMIITSSSAITDTRGVAQNSYVVEALNPQTGAQVWHSQIFGVFPPQHIAVGGDTVYAVTQQYGYAGNPTTLAAFDISSGATHWKKNSNSQYHYANALLANVTYVYVLGDFSPSIYSKDGTEQSFTSDSSAEEGVGILIGGQLIGSNGGGLARISPAGPAPSIVDPYRYENGFFYSSGQEMAASNGLLFIAYGHSFFSPGGLNAYDLNSGKQVWRSLALSGDPTGSQFIIGNGMLYMVYSGEIHAYAGARLPLVSFSRPSYII